MPMNHAHISQSPANLPLTVAQLISDLQEAMRLGILSPTEEIYIIRFNQIYGDGSPNITGTTEEYTDRVNLGFRDGNLTFTPE